MIYLKVFKSNFITVPMVGVIKVPLPPWNCNGGSPNAEHWFNDLITCVAADGTQDCIGRFSMNLTGLFVLQ